VSDPHPATDWVEKSVSELAGQEPNALATGPFGSAISAKHFRPSGIPVIRGGNLSADSGIRLRDTGLVFLEPAKAQEFARSTVRDGDLVFTCWGTINQVGLINERAAHRAYVISNKQMKLTVDTSVVSPEFLYYLFSGPDLQREILEGAIGSSIPGFNLTQLRSMRVRLPDPTEQDAIAAALSDADDLIAGLQRLIRKKEAIGQGLMQELLTGRTRLHGFDGQWRDLHVATESVLKARIGWQGLTTAEYRAQGDYRLVGGTDFRRGEVDWSSTPYVDHGRYAQDPHIQLRTGDVLLTKDGTVGKTAYVADLPGPATLNSGVYVLRPKEKGYESHFLFFMLRSRAFRDFLARLSAGSSISHLYQRDLVGLVLRVPTSNEEQKAIAEVLGDVDSEVTSLRERSEKANAMKRGLMQELLSGRTRLRSDAAAVSSAGETVEHEAVAR
jgi:type I restriction enzyme S subunit